MIMTRHERPSRFVWGGGRIDPETGAIEGAGDDLPGREPPERPDDAWLPGDLPHVVDGIVIPAASVEGSGCSVEWVPVHAVGQVRKHRKLVDTDTGPEMRYSVGFYSQGKWVLAWHGRTEDGQREALAALLAGIAGARVGRRR